MFARTSFFVCLINCFFIKKSFLSICIFAANDGLHPASPFRQYFHILKNAWYKILYHAQKRGLDLMLPHIFTFITNTTNYSRQYKSYFPSLHFLQKNTKLLYQRQKGIFLSNIHKTILNVVS